MCTFKTHQNTAVTEELVAAGFILSGKNQDDLQKLHIDDVIGNWFLKNIFHKFQLNNTSKLVLYIKTYRLGG